jgi:protein phosphatase
VRLVSGAATDKGQVREGNEDAYVVDPRLRLFAVADGMGGHQAGEVASATALEALRAAIASGLAVGDSITRANAAVLEKADEDDALTGMGTTITALVPEGEHVLIGHVGDSRAYLLREGEIVQVTDDHSLVEELVREGRITEEQAAVHPQRSIITRALGVDTEVQVDVVELTLRAGDRVLLCSDGLTTMLRAPEIATILRREADPTRCANALVDAANAAGGDDNITTVVIDVVDDDIDGGSPADPAGGRAATAGSAPTLTDSTVTDLPAVDAPPDARADAPVDLPAAAPPSAPAPEPPAPPAGRSRRERRTDRHVGRSIGRFLWFAVPILLILGLGIAAIAWYARRTYFVAFERGTVVLYQGRPGGLLLWDPTVVRRTTLHRNDLPEQVQVAIEGEKSFSNRGDAVAYVIRFENQARTAATSTTTTTVAPPVTTGATPAR